MARLVASNEGLKIRNKGPESMIPLLGGDLTRPRCGMGKLNCCLEGNFWSPLPLPGQ